MARLCPPQSERLWFVGGRPGNFKTQLCWNLCCDIAERKQRAIFISLEQTTQELGLQALARYSQIPLDRLILAHNADSGVLLRDDEQAVVEYAEKRIEKLGPYLRLHGADTHGRNIEDVFSSAIRHTFAAVFLDHIGMVEGPGNEFENIKRTVNGLRGLCRGEVKRDYRPFVCATSPLNRNADRDNVKEERPPSLSDFAGSSRIESDADLAMILRKRQRVDEDGPDKVDAFVMKNRQGRSPLVITFEAEGAICTVKEQPPISYPPLPRSGP